MARPATKRKRKPLVVVLLLAIGSLVALEAALRVRQFVKYGTLSPSFYELTTHEASGLRIPTPNSEIGPIHINSLGFRGDELDVPKPEGTLRIAFLGGSTTFCAEAASTETTWPHLVTAALRDAFPEARFDFVNGGAGGYSTEQSLLNLEHRIAPLEPDVVVIYHGTNDLTQDSRDVAAERGLFDPSVEELSTLGKLSLTWFLIEKNLRFRARQDAGHEGAAKLELDPTEIAPRFRERLDALVGRAQEIAPLVVVGTFATHVRGDQSPEAQLVASSSSLYYMPYWTVGGILAGFEEYNRVIRDVANARGALLVEPPAAIPGDPAHFADSVHLTDAGCERMAECVSKALIASPELAKLVAEHGGE